MKVEAFVEKTSVPNEDMIVSSREIIARDLQKREQTTHYYTKTYKTSGTPYKTIIITETAVPFVPPPENFTSLTVTLYYPTCHVFDCHWSFSHTGRVIKVKFSEKSTKTVTSTISDVYQNDLNSKSLESNSLYPTDVKYVVIGTISGAIVGILSGIALTFGFNKLKSKNDGVPTPSSDPRFK
ncbi:23179_t:CDS:1 [Cetraspora pellucida]|uniref:23179_t:CDS:1 n=1 Tax=Cetraspora pellucida TaxID=1433469 RepID=A0A9N9DP34_9GLOM|nr:23179_t:CDS:1 [Cetraspora pellucida]